MRKLALVFMAVAVASGGLAHAQCCNDACPAPAHDSYIGVHGKGSNDAGGLDTITNAGFHWIRIRVGWAQTETGENVYNWGPAEAAITPAYQHGLSILLYFHGVPSWANGGNGQTTPPNAAHANSYGDFITQVINHPMSTLNGKRIGEVAAAFELWNEPNLGDFWSGGAATWKTRILAPGINAIKAARAQHHFSPAWIVAPSVYSNTDKNVSVDIGTWVSGYMVDIDFASLHTYGSEGAQIGELDAANGWCANNANCAGFWMTEGGFETYGCGQANCSSSPGSALLHTQNHCANILTCFKNFIFNLYDVENDSGLVNNAGAVRNRLCTLESGYGAPLHVSAPCPCSAGKPGCANQP